MSGRAQPEPRRPQSDTAVAITRVAAAVSLRTLTPATLPAVVAILHDPRVGAAWAGGTRLAGDEAASPFWHPAPGRFVWSVHPADDDATTAGCIRLDDGEVGYFVAADCWSRGYATAALAGCIALARRARLAERLTATIPRDNRASIRVVEKAGFAFAGLAALDDRAIAVVRYALIL